MLSFNEEIFSLIFSVKSSTWGNWSLCSKTCGKGLQERNGTKATNTLNGIFVDSIKETRSCNNENCPGIHYYTIYVVHVLK